LICSNIGEDSKSMAGIDKREQIAIMVVLNAGKGIE